MKQEDKPCESRQGEVCGSAFKNDRDAVRLLLILLQLALPAMLHAQFIFTTNNGALTLSRYIGANRNVVIPSTTNGLPVTSIGANAFYESFITNVVIPNSITNIGSSAFAYNRGLSTISIPDSVTLLGESAFANCDLIKVAIGSGVTNIENTDLISSPYLLTIVVDPANPAYSSLANVLFDKNQTALIRYPSARAGEYVIPDSVTNVANYAFENSSRLTNVTVSAAVNTIGTGAFRTCFNLAAINVDAGNSNYNSDTGVLFDKAQNTLIQYPAGKFDVIYAIPHTVTDIRDYAFSRSLLAGVASTNGLVTVGDYAFSFCGNLTSVILPDDVTRIGDYAFYFCTNLTSFRNSGNVTVIGSFTFAYCTSLTGIGIPNGVTTIPDYAFWHCESLTNITFPNSVTNIGSGAFLACYDLTAFSIPESVTRLGNGVCYACSSLTSVSLPNSITSVEGDSFIQCTSLTNVVLGTNITTIGDTAFAGCTNLTSIVIPASVTNIANLAFFQCSGLRAVYFPGDAPAVATNAFQEDDSVVAYYVPGTSGWGPTFGGASTAPWLPSFLTEDSSFGVRSNQFGFNIAWANGKVVVVEASADLASSTWAPVGTNTIENGLSYFSDSLWTNYLGRFYRLRSP